MVLVSATFMIHSVILNEIKLAALFGFLLGWSCSLAIVSIVGGSIARQHLDTIRKLEKDLEGNGFGLCVRRG